MAIQSVSVNTLVQDIIYRFLIHFNIMFMVLLIFSGTWVLGSPKILRAQLAFTVNSLADAPDDSLGDGICADKLGNCTLRAAIEQALGNSVTVTFDVAGTINLTTGPLVVPNGSVIAGTNQEVRINGNGNTILFIGSNTLIQGLVISNGFIGIQIVGSNNTIGGITSSSSNVISGNESHGIFVGGSGSANKVEGNLISENFRGIGIGSSNNTIGGSTLAARNVISGNQSAGIVVGGSGNLIIGNFIGTNSSGTASWSNGSGIIINGSNNKIGGTTVGERNVISGNEIDGINIFKGAGNVVQGNYIGTDVTGTSNLGNATTTFEGAGIRISGTNNTVGGSTSGAGNVISGNESYGIIIVENGSANKLQGNFIGTDISGRVELGNGNSGIFIIQNSSDNFIGNNLISANAGPGVAIEGNGAVRNVLQGNLIGTDVSGTIKLANSQGVFISAPNNQIGGTSDGDRNLISGNKSVGIQIATSDATGNSVIGNLIGTDISGSNPLPNGSDGILINDADSTTVGGQAETAANVGNTIAFNSANGVHVFKGTGNAILGNSIFSNVGLGIDLNPNGVTPNDLNDSDSGANDLQNFPELNFDTNNNIIQGTLNSTPKTEFRIEFFDNSECDPSGHGEGENFLGFRMVTTNENGHASFTFTTTDQNITATATDPNNNTSEFSQCPFEIELLDPIADDLSPVLIEDGEITQDVNKLAEADDSLARVGVATDGVTKLVLRMDGNAGDQIQLYLEDDSQENGKLSTLDGSQSGSSIIIEAENTSMGGKGFAIYEAPAVFFDTQSELFAREITIKGENITTGSTAEKKIKLIRPPVVLLHGIWSGPSLWDSFALNKPTPKYNIFVANYLRTNAKFYNFNRNVLPKWIDQALSSLKKRKFGVVKVDVVAHSMGGVLARWYLAEINTRQYTRKENYFSGEIRKLITIGTPHSGTPLANFAYSLRSVFIPGVNKSIAQILRDFDRPIDGDDGAVFDLAVPQKEFSNNGTAILNSRTEHTTKVHSIVAHIDLGPNIAFELIPVIGRVLLILSFVTGLSLDAIYQDQPNDVAVPTLSQGGGLRINAQSEFQGISHFAETKNAEIASRVDALLEMSPDASSFEGQFDPVPFSISPQLAQAVKKAISLLDHEQPTASSTFVQITSPPDGYIVSPGQKITVAAQGSNGEPLSKVLFLTPDTSVVDEVASFEFELMIPQEALGTYIIGALGKDSGGNNSYDDLQISVQTSVGLDSIKVDPPSVLLTTENEKFPLLTKGVFADGIIRDITESGKGTSYSSNNLSVVTVNDAGILMAVSDGQAVVTVTNDGISEEVEVSVNILFLDIDFPPACINNGDVNGDGAMTPGDALCCFQIFLSGGNLSPDCQIEDFDCELIAAEVNCDGTVTPGDALAIFRRFLDGLPPEECFARESSPLTKRSRQEEPYQISLKQRTFSQSNKEDRNEIIKVTLEIDNPQGLDAFGLSLKYPVNMLEFIEVERTALTTDWIHLDGQLAEPGKIIIGGFNNEPLSSTSSVELFHLVFASKSETINLTDFEITDLVDGFKEATVQLSETGVAMIPEQFKLHQNYPNPFNPITKIQFEVLAAHDDGVRVQLALYNISGQLVRSLLDKKHSPGSYEIEWDGQNGAGIPVPSGIYFYTLRAGDFKATKKMLLLK